jgi:hypothetical protein
MPTSFDSDGKAAYVYNLADDTWYQVSGKTDISGTFEWTGLHTHLSTLTTADHLNAKKGINNFLNPAARDSTISSPTAGTICFVRQDPSGNPLKELQVYDGSSWIAIIPSAINQNEKYLKSDGTISTWSKIDDAFTTSFLMMGG